jgi:hypothetical protein
MIRVIHHGQLTKDIEDQKSNRKELVTVNTSKFEPRANFGLFCSDVLAIIKTRPTEQ